MAKDRFVQNLFPDLDLSVADKAELQALVTIFIEEHLPNYREYCANKTRQVDTNRWKLFKTKDNVRLHSERDSKDNSSSKKKGHEVANMPSH
ncbi:hypothetical protein PI125_g9204 [Phytophthora idaei]|nr:hypothetical protein PI125_g9204 [Phytophthora idaei]KAG3159036.1 hypothetical protein PI126_g7584 [Phytophthora idaei]